ncbi:MAG TPA: RluA family pseudouridine synthase [Hyphomicrobiaceae bacterium]|nr:RluA family pseudouridine synthase [Hyphomicrobiaceae bacterium]
MTERHDGGDDPDPGTTLRIELDAADDGQRLDVALTRHVDGLSRSRVQALIRDGRVRHSSGATIVSHGLRVKSGDVVLVTVPPPEPAVPVPEAIPLVILYEDRDVIVIDKPKGLVVHPAPGHATGTLVNALINHCGDTLSGVGGVRRPGIVHRLDKDTTGVMVAAKNDMAHQSLSEQFAAHGSDGRMERGYLALCWGIPQPRSGRIDAAIGRRTHNRTKMAVVHEDRGRHAATRYEVIERFEPAGRPPTSLVRCTLETGRTHQVRVHLAHIGHPLLGDATYGAGFAASVKRLGPAAQQALTALNRQALHAAMLAFEHPRKGKKMCFDSDLPDDIAGVVRALRTGA